MVKIKLSKEEKRILKNYNKTSKLILIRLKSQAVLLRFKKMKIKDIADVLDKDNRTIGRWLWDFKKRRLASIFTGHKDNENASKLTHIQKEEIKKYFLKNHRILDSQENFGMFLNLKHIFGWSSKSSMKQTVLITFF